MNEEYGDTDRLAELGASALDLAVTNYLYLVKPFLSGTEIHVCVYILLFFWSLFMIRMWGLTICFGRF